MSATQKGGGNKTGRRKEAREPEFLSIDPPRRQVVITSAVALAITIFLHVLLVESVPTLDLFGDFDPKAADGKGRTFRVHMVKPQPEEEQPLPPDQYVQTNPEAPENKPDETPNFGAQDQQASQIEESEELGPNPESDGELEDSNALVSGMRSTEVPPSPPVPQTQAQQGSQQAENTRPDMPILPDPPAPPQLPDAFEGEATEEGTGVAAYERIGKEQELPEQDPPEKVVPATRNVEEAMRIAEQMSQRSPDGPPTVQPQQPRRPQPRLYKLPDALPSVINKNDSGIANATGVMAFDANFSEYGDYLSRVFDIIGIEWNKANAQAKGLTDMRTFVRVRFFINKDGQIEDLEVVQSTASQLAEWRCIDAIKGNAPYFPWTKDMVAVLGDRQPVEVGFYYR